MLYFIFEKEAYKLESLKAPSYNMSHIDLGFVFNFKAKLAIIKMLFAESPQTN